MNGKKWLKVWFLTITACIFILMSINYIIDPSNIFNSNFLKKYGQLNERYLKIKYLNSNYKKYDSYMFGSSRIGTTEPSAIEKYIPNSKFYNFTLSMATIHDYLVYLKHFSKHYQVKNIYVQIDIENILHHTTGGFHRKDHPDVSKENILDFYRVHLLGIYPVGWRKKIKNNFFINSEQSYNLTNGVWYRQTREAQISSDCSEYIKRESTFHKINKRVNGAGKNYEKTIQALKELKNISNVNNINLIVLTTPHNHNMMDSYKLDAYLKFLYDISQITDFYDFSGYNTITTNDCNYYEESHYRPFIGKIIAARIFNDKSIEIPNDFGVFVTKDNINEHLKYKKLEVFNHDNKKFN